MYKSIFKKKSTPEFLKELLLEGAADQVGKRIGEDFWWEGCGYITDKLSERMMIENTYGSPYDEFQEILYQLDPEQFEKRAQPTGSNMVKRLTTNSRYIIIKKGLIITVRVKSYYSGSSGDTKIDYTLLRLYGPNAHKFHNFVVKRLSTANTKNQIAVFKQGSLGISEKQMISKVSVYNTLFPTKLLRKLIRTLHSWTKDRSFYEEHKIPYKLGILLYGNPGSGKSTMIRLIASILNSPILEIDPAYVSSFQSTYKAVKEKTDRPVIIVIEDVDFFFRDRKSEGGIGIDPGQHALFQILDGLHSPENVVFIVTTNYFDDLDPALKRRFDLLLELGYWDKELAAIYAERMGFKKKDLKELKIEYPVQPSLLKSKLIGKRLEK